MAMMLAKESIAATTRAVEQLTPEIKALFDLIHFFQGLRSLISESGAPKLQLRHLSKHDAGCPEKT